MISPQKWLFVAMCISSLSLAQAPSPGVMPFPLEFKRTPPGLTTEDKDSLQREYTRLLRLTGARIPDFARYDFALKELKRQDCEREDECLVQLAKKAESLYALYASVDYTLEGSVWVSGRVVRDDGKVASPTQTVKVPEGEYKENAMKAIEQLFIALKLGELPAERPVEVKPPVAVIAPPPALPEIKQVDDRGGMQRSVGQAVFVVGAVAAAVSAGALVAGQVIGSDLTPTPQRNLPLEQLSDFQTARMLTSTGLVGVAAGGATALVGALIWGLAPSGPVRVSVITGPSGTMISAQGEF